MECELENKVVAETDSAPYPMEEWANMFVPDDEDCPECGAALRQDELGFGVCDSCWERQSDEAYAGWDEE